MSALIPLDLVVVLIGAAVAGLLADKLKQPTLIAYLLAGIIVGPGILGLADPTELIEIMAELGLAFLLFLIGLKLDFGEIEHIFRPVIGISIPQMLLVAALSMVLTVLMGFEPVPAVIMGLAFMYSSTAVVVKLLNDTGGISKEYGQINTGILLVQDLAVVILMVVVASAGEGILSGLGPAFGFLIAAILITLFAVKYVLPKMVFEASKDSVNLLVTGMMWLFVFVVAAEYFGLSLEVGAFIAGLGLGQINYSRELVEKVSPITDFFIALFFLNFGLNLSLGEFLTFWQEALILSLFLMPGKYLIISKLVEWQGFNKETSFKSGITMTQTSEFSLIFIAAAATAGLVTDEIVGLVSLVAIITMSLSTYFIIFRDKIFEKLDPEVTQSKSEEDEKEDHAIVAGVPEGLEEIREILEKEFSEVYVIDSDPEKVESFEDVEFDNFHHRDVRKSLDVDKAGLIMVNFEDESLVKEVRQENSEALILAKLDEDMEGVETYDDDELIGEEMKRFIEGWRDE